MDDTKHIHIISAGESIHKTFPKAVNEFKVDRAIVIVEEGVFKNPNIERNSLIINSIDEVNKISKILNKSFEIKYIPSISLENIRDAVLDIFNKHTNSNFYFNITSGTKILSNGLFMMSMWIEGTTYYINEDSSLQILTIPKMKVKNIEKNINYITILDLLSKSENNEILQKRLFLKIRDEYKPVKQINQKTKRNLSRGTLSKWLFDMVSWGLITVDYFEDNKKEKVIKITHDGIFALKFINATNCKKSYK
jgi:hypothetical protein